MIVCCFALFFVFLSALCGAAPVDPNVTNALALPLLLGGTAGPNCSVGELESLTGELPPQLVNQLVACLTQKPQNGVTCPPGGLNKLVEQNQARLRSYTQKLSKCGRSTQPDLQGPASPGPDMAPGSDTAPPAAPDASM